MACLGDVDHTRYAPLVLLPSEGGVDMHAQALHHGHGHVQERK